MDRAEAIKQLDGAEMVLLNRNFKPFNQAIIMAITALREQEQSKWISVKERLPEDWAIIQIVEDNGYVWLPKIGEYRYGRNQWFVEGCFEASHGWLEDDKMFHVTHWMPLPEPPKEGAEG